MSDKCNYRITRAQVVNINDNGAVMVTPTEGRFKGRVTELPPRESASIGTNLVISIHPSGNAKWP